MANVAIDKEYLLNILLELLKIPSPTGYTDSAVHFVGKELKRIGIPFDLTRRGAIRANLEGKESSPDRAIVSHLDTTGVMVRELKENGRLALTPIGSWSARFAEGCRVTVFTDSAPKRGTILPLKSSGHIFNEEVDSLPISWDHVELRIDEKCSNDRDLHEAGFRVGDYVAVDPNPEVLDSGFLVSRHVDGKAGAAIALALGKALMEGNAELPIDLHLLFTITEEVGSGASAVLHQDVAELVTLDIATPGPSQNSSEYGATIVMKDAAGPFDYHLTQKLIELCKSKNIEFTRDVLRHYYCDSASAIEAGNDIRTALIGYACDASHGSERTHIDSLMAVAELSVVYALSERTVKRDKKALGPLEGFPTQPDQEWESPVFFPEEKSKKKQSSSQ
ncbi:osmoprotectant NAGGN system M42 family peptidase [bacterium]|nr:osmoprotectant NAGGN system M42 family peptidase [bacterium]